MRISKKWLVVPFLFLPLVLFQNFTSTTESLIPGVPQNPARSWVDFGCSQTGNNKGCTQKISCPLGTRPVSARMICNLEKPTLNSAELAKAPLDTIRILQKSNRIADGVCYINDSLAAKGDSVLPPFPNYNSTLKFGCSEQEANGGDCAVQGQVLCEEYYGPLQYMNTKAFPKNVIQGMARLTSAYLLLATDTGNGKWVDVTRKIKGSDGKEKTITEQVYKAGTVAFAVVSPSGDEVVNFSFPYDSHPQSLHITKVPAQDRSAGYYEVLVSSADRLGLAVFHLSESFKAMKFVREIMPTRKNDELKFGSFHIDANRDRMGIVSWDPEKKGYYLALYPFSKMYAGKKNIKEITRIRLDEAQNKQKGWVQGVVLSDNFAYVLSGNFALHNKKDPSTYKNLYRYRLDGTAVATFNNVAGSGAAAAEGDHYEPESLYIEKDKIYFSMNSGDSTKRVHRIYRMSEKYWAPESFRHEFVLRDLSGTNKLFQGLALLPNKNWLVTHDLDSNKNHDKMMFEILDPQGRAVMMTKGGKKVAAQFPITLPGNASHGQSIGLIDSGDSYSILMENGQSTGVSIYRMAKDYSSITYKKDILFSKDLGFKAKGIVAIDKSENRLAVYGKNGEAREVRIFNLEKFLAGKIVHAEGTAIVVVEDIQSVSMQGIAIQGSSVYVLNGNSDPTEMAGNEKLLYRYSILTGKLIDRRAINIGRPAAAAQGKFYEPEGLHAYDGYLYFSVNIRGGGDPLENKVYRVSELNF